MPGDYLDVDTDAVASAGNATAGTSGEWSGWASQVATQLRGAASSASESEVSSAIEGFLSMWNPRLQGLAANAEALGINAASASHAVVNADGTSTGMLNQVAATDYGSCPVLSRPITSD